MGEIERVTERKRERQGWETEREREISWVEISGVEMSGAEMSNPQIFLLIQ